MKNFTKYLIGAILAIVLAIVFYIEALELSNTAARLPKLLIGVIIVLAVCMIIEGRIKDKKTIEYKKVKEEEGIKENHNRRNYKRTFIFTLIIILYILTIKPIGYFIMTPLYIIGTYMYLKSTTYKNNLIISLCFTIFIYLLFIKFLKLPIPLGFMS